MIAIAIKKIATLGLFFRLKPYDCSSAQGRSNERYRRIAVTSFTSVSAKCISILVSLVSVPLTLKYLGAERYGLWMTASSLIVVLGFSDLGIGNGLLNAISEAYGKEDQNAAKEAISSAFYLLAAVSLLIMVVFLLVYPFVPWQKVFNVTSIRATKEAGPAIFVLIMLFAVNIPLASVQRVQMGFQEGYVNDLYQIAGNLLALCGILISTSLLLGLPWLITFFVGAPLAATATNFITQFYVTRPSLRPRFKLVNLKVAKGVLSNGAVLLFLTVLTLIGFQTDNFFIAHFHGAASVTNYSIVQKMSTVAILYWAFITALWPAYGEAFARVDFYWVRKTVLRSLKLSVLGGLLIGGGLFLFGARVVKLWLGDSVIIARSLLLGFAVFILINGLIATVAVVFNSSFLIRRQVTPFICATLCALLLKYLIARHLGPNYIVWSTTMGYGCFYLIPCLAMLRRELFCRGQARGT